MTLNHQTTPVKEKKNGRPQQKSFFDYFAF